MVMVHMVVTNYRTPDDLHRFCESVQKFAPKDPWSLTIINVSPLPADMAVGERWADKLGAGHCWFEVNIGYGRACNEGACRALWPPDTSEGVLAFFNADVILTRRAVDNCVEGLLSRSDWGVLGPRQVNNQGKLTHAGIFGTHTKPQHRAWLAAAKSSQYTDVRDDAITVSGAAYFIRRSLWDELCSCPIFRQVAPEARGAFLPTPFYYEETWVSYHAYAHGKGVVYWGQDTLIHKWQQAVITNKKQAWAALMFEQSGQRFREACDAHGIPRD